MYNTNIAQCITEHCSKSAGQCEKEVKQMIKNMVVKLSSLPRTIIYLKKAKELTIAQQNYRHETEFSNWLVTK